MRRPHESACLQPVIEGIDTDNSPGTQVAEDGVEEQTGGALTHDHRVQVEDVAEPPETAQDRAQQLAHEQYFRLPVRRERQQSLVGGEDLLLKQALLPVESPQKDAFAFAVGT